MFHEVEKKFRKKRRKDPLQNNMMSYLPQLSTMVTPSPVSTATDSRIKIEDSHEEIRVWINEHPHQTPQIKEVFQRILGKVKALTERINKTRKRLQK